MFNRFRKKQPEKPKPNFQGEQHKHKACVIIFDGTKASSQLHQYKDQYEKSTIVKGKTIARLSSMLESCEQISSHHMSLQRGCITTLNIAETYQEYVAIAMGIKPPGETQGFSICPGCLQQAIISCKEVLQSLEDIQEATKEYV